MKFFASDPQNLRDEYTRYLVVLQLREDIRTGKLPCEDLRLAAELAALLLQGLPLDLSLYSNILNEIMLHLVAIKNRDGIFSGGQWCLFHYNSFICSLLFEKSQTVEHITPTGVTHSVPFPIKI